MGITIKNRIIHALLFPNDQKALAKDENDMKCKVSGNKIPGMMWKET
jgi:hypothetical protein